MIGNKIEFEFLQKSRNRSFCRNLRSNVHLQITTYTEHKPELCYNICYNKNKIRNKLFHGTLLANRRETLWQWNCLQLAKKEKGRKRRESVGIGGFSS